MTCFDVVNDTPTTNKTIFLRCDLDVPLNENGAIIDDRKIKDALPTLNYLVKTGARVVIGTHLGNPKGEKNEKLSTRVLAEYLDRHLRCDVFFCDDCIGEDTKRTIFRASYGDVVMLENLRFYKEEYTCDLNFAKQLADGMNVYVNDTFAVSNHSYASIIGVPLFIRSTAGFSLQREVENLDKVLQGGGQNIIAIIGGGRLSAKIDIINNLIEKVQYIFICGAVANTFFKEAGYNIGKSMYEPEYTKYVDGILKKATLNNCIIATPEEVIVSKDITGKSKTSIKKITELEDDDIIVDVGEKYVNLIKMVINKTKYVIWNGTLGISEMSAFNKGDMSLIDEITKLTKKKKIFSIAGGNDTFASIIKSGKQDDFSFLSYNGESFTNYLAGRVVPGVEILHRLAKQPE